MELFGEIGWIVCLWIFLILLSNFMNLSLIVHVIIIFSYLTLFNIDKNFKDLNRNIPIWWDNSINEKISFIIKKKRRARANERKYVSNSFNVRT